MFQKEDNVIPSLIIETLRAFTPPFRQRLASYVLVDSNPRPLNDLISAYDITLNFSKSIVPSLSSAGFFPFFSSKTKRLETKLSLQSLNLILPLNKIIPN